MIDLDAIPFVRCRWYRKTNGRSIDYVVLHDMEFPERPDSAEWCANFFATSDRQGSTHYTADNNSLVRCADMSDVCYGANGVNHNGIHIEMAGYAKQTEEEWDDEYSRALLANVAELVAALCARWLVPIEYIDADGLRAGRRGITTHLQAEQAFPYGGHWDPGYNFPIDRFIAQVKALSTSPSKETDMFMLVGPGGVNDGTFLVDLWSIRWVSNGNEVNVLNQAGVPTVTTTSENIRIMRAGRTPFGPSPTSGAYVGLW